MAPKFIFSGLPGNHVRLLKVFLRILYYDNSSYSMIYYFLDIFFVIFHTSLIIFNLLAWVWEKTRILNLITLFLTGASWLILGSLVGTFGYCPLTDWHFAVLQKIGKSDLPSSYIKYLADRITGMDFNATLTDRITFLGFITALMFSLIFNILDFFRKRGG